MGHGIPLLIAITVVGGVGGCAPRMGFGPVTRLPTAPVMTLAGERMDLAGAASGRVALVSLWATWCDGCQQEVDALNRLDASTAVRRDAVVIGVAVGEPRTAVAAFVRTRGLHYLQLVDEEFRLADALGERRLPTTLVVDRSGRIVYRGDALDAGGLAALRTAIGSGEMESRH